MTSYVMVLQGGASIVVDAGSLTLSGKVVSLSVNSSSSFSLACNAGSIVVSGVAASLTTQGGSYLVDDNFEGGNPSGWSLPLNEITITGGTVSITTNDGGSISGSNAYRQWWDGAAGRPYWLRYNFPTPPQNGDVLEWDFWLKYDANFNANPPNIKLMTMRGASSEIYFESHDTFSGDFLVFIQNMPTPVNRRYYGNVNGGQVFLNHGTWQHIVVQIKMSTTSGPEDGFIQGWVDGVKRFEYFNIHTYETGNFDYWQWETTSMAPSGANQKRWTDNLKFRINP